MVRGEPLQYRCISGKERGLGWKYVHMTGLVPYLPSWFENTRQFLLGDTLHGFAMHIEAQTVEEVHPLGDLDL